MSTERVYVVDRFEGHIAVLDEDAGQIVNVSRASLPHQAKEGDVLRVPLDADASENWALAYIDAPETRRRRAEAEQTRDELSRLDRGGELKL